MLFRSEVKDFIKNTTIFTLFFTLILHLSWGYVAPYLGLGANASSNDARFAQANITYLWNIATAVSLNIGQKDTGIAKNSIYINNDIISISEVLSSPNLGQKKLIGGNMVAINAYINILKTDIVGLLDGATDRTATLDEHISLLKSYGNKTNERLIILDEQIADLKAIIAKNATDVTTAKSVMQTTYEGFDYTGVDGAIDTYTKAKQEDIRARVYLVYLEKFQSTYLLLQAQNVKLLDTLTTNREALIKRSMVVVPSSGTALLKELNLIQTEAEYKAKKNLE
jgi:hypothetical protein